MGCICPTEVDSRRGRDQQEHSRGIQRVWGAKKWPANAKGSLEAMRVSQSTLGIHRQNPEDI
jgi:hypothetical protein